MDGRLLIANSRLESPEKGISSNPATLEPVGEFFLAQEEQCAQAVQAAKKAFPAWRDLAAAEKRSILRRAKAILLRRAEEAARLITFEKGSPLSESFAVEVLGSLEVTDYYARNLEKSQRAKRARHHVVFFLHKRSAFHFQPLGPTLVISPWNFPFLISCYDVLSALAAGNTVVLRPSSSTPLCALLIGEIFLEAGLPPGVLNIINCRIPLAEDLITHPDIQTVMFTGSVPTGKRIMELASRNLTNIVLELGGKDPMVVCRDADLEKAARGAVWAAFMNSGQSCAAVERVYVDRDIAEEFTARVVGLTRQLRVKSPLEPDTDMGPMANAGQLRVVESHIRDAEERGARVLWGGKRLSDLPGYFIQPTVMSGVDHSMLVMSEETFGPVLPIMPFADPEEAVDLANDCLYGLTASVWTRSRKTAAWMAERIESGTVTINDHMTSFVEPAAIWGGIKQTGIGRSHGPFGRLELVNIKFISYDFLRKKTQIWWYPYDEGLLPLLNNSVRLFHHERMGPKAKALWSLRSSLKRVSSGSAMANYIKGLPRLFRP